MMVRMTRTIRRRYSQFSTLMHSSAEQRPCAKSTGPRTQKRCAVVFISRPTRCAYLRRLKFQAVTTTLQSPSSVCYCHFCSQASTVQATVPNTQNVPATAVVSPAVHLTSREHLETYAHYNHTTWHGLGTCKQVGQEISIWSLLGRRPSSIGANGNPSWAQAHQALRVPTRTRGTHCLKQGGRGLKQSAFLGPGNTNKITMFRCPDLLLPHLRIAPLKHTNQWPVQERIQKLAKEVQNLKR
jgi:acetyltransferase-like isoleucine patch superfamily enzyme